MKGQYIWRLMGRGVLYYERWTDSHEGQFCWRGKLTLVLTSARMQMGLSQTNMSQKPRPLDMLRPTPGLTD